MVKLQLSTGFVQLGPQPYQLFFSPCYSFCLLSILIFWSLSNLYSHSHNNIYLNRLLDFGDEFISHGRGPHQNVLKLVENAPGRYDATI